MNTQLAKWGQSLAVKIPKSMADRAQMREGDSVELFLSEDGSVIIRPKHQNYTLDQLVDGITPENRHEETDWGDPVGRETW